jgi:hypothetical protein
VKHCGEAATCYPEETEGEHKNMLQGLYPESIQYEAVMVFKPDLMKPDVIYSVLSQIPYTTK